MLEMGLSLCLEQSVDALSTNALYFKANDSVEERPLKPLRVFENVRR